MLAGLPASLSNCPGHWKSYRSTLGKTHQGRNREEPLLLSLPSLAGKVWAGGTLLDVVLGLFAHALVEMLCVLFLACIVAFACETLLLQIGLLYMTLAAVMCALYGHHSLLLWRCDF